MIMPISLNAGGFYLMERRRTLRLRERHSGAPTNSRNLSDAEAARPVAQTRCGLIPLWQASASVAEWGIIRFQSLNTRCLGWPLTCSLRQMKKGLKGRQL